MLIEFGVRNFLSFKEGVQVSFKLNSNCPENISQGKPFTNVLCIKGANGSGKSNVLKVLAFLNDFCCNSFSKKPDEQINCEPFFRNNEPIDFYVEFMSNETFYKYELSLNKTKVLNETLYRKSKRVTKVLERKLNEITYNISDFDDIKVIKKLRSNASIISIANQYELKVLEPVYKFFNSIITNADIPNFISFLADVSRISKIYYEAPELLEFSKEIICKSDLGINDIKIIKKDDGNGNDNYFPNFYHSKNNKDFLLTYHEESSGTKSLFNQLLLYKTALKEQSVLVLDEFDINLHPHILPLLVNLFLDPEINRNNSQMVFSTHNTEIMDKLGKYRTFLVNKEDNESFGYRLDDIPGEMVRNDRAITPLYNEGKIGGVPKL